LIRLRKGEKKRERRPEDAPNKKEKGWATCCLSIQKGKKKGWGKEEKVGSINRANWILKIKKKGEGGEE